jgi:hypothetical protein
MQLDLHDGEAVAHLWGWIGPGVIKFRVRQGGGEPQGWMVGTSMSPLCRWLSPFLAKD